MKLSVLNIVFVAAFLSLASLSMAQPEIKSEKTTRILFILDASKSMSGKWQGQVKFKIASKILSDVLDSLKTTDKLQVALRIYGHQRNYPPQNCNDTKLEVAFAANNFDRIKQRLKYIKPQGTSPIAMSLERAKSDFGNNGNYRNIIILISDGIEECDGDICEASASLQQEGIALRPFIIGIGADNSQIFDCAGSYFNAPDIDSFQSTLNIIIKKVLSKTTLQVNLLDKNGRAKESNINMAFTDMASGKIVYNFVHTLNNKGLPDTLVVDPLLEYKITLGTFPPIEINNVSLTQGKHNIVYANCPRGKLSVALNGNYPSEYKPKVIVKSIKNKIINTQWLGEKISYLQGSYKIEVLSLPIIELDKINIEADKTTSVKIDSPGILSIQKNIRVYGFLYYLTDNKQIKILDLNENSSKQESIYLQPGFYRLVYRPIYSTQSAYSQTEDFEITSSKTTKIKL